MQFDSAPVKVYGVDVPNAEVARLARIVMIMSTFVALVIIALAILNFTIFFTQTSVYQSVVGIVLGMFVPIFGFIGAKKRSRNMVGCFTGCSFGCSIFNLIGYILIMMSISALQDTLVACNSRSYYYFHPICTIEYTPESLFIYASCSAVPVIVIQLIAGIFGSKLYRRLQPDFAVVHSIEPRPAVVATIAPSV
jgi:hypothetical protein